MSEERLLTEKEFKAANPGKDRRHYKKYKKEFRKRLKAGKMEVKDVGIVEKIATVPQAIAEHMKPDEARAIKFSLADADAERMGYYLTANGALREALALTADTGNGALLAEHIKKAFVALVDMEKVSRDAFRAVAAEDAYSKRIIEIAEKAKLENGKVKEKVKGFFEWMDEYEKTKLEEKKEVD